MLWRSSARRPRRARVGSPATGRGLMAAKGVFYVFAYASGPARHKRCYGRRVGWPLGPKEPEVAGFAFGNGYLVLHADDRPTDARRYAAGMHVAVQVDDARAEHARLAGLGLRVSAVQDQPWGERSFS